MEITKRGLKVKEAASYIGMSRSQLFKMSAFKPTKEKPIRKIKYGPRSVRWDILDLDAYLEQLKE